VTTDDEVTIGAIRFLHASGRRVPADVALVSFDDLPVAAHAEVPLTTLAQPAEDVGRRLATLLRDGLKSPARIAECRISLPPGLVIRESCGARAAGFDREGAVSVFSIPVTKGEDQCVSEGLPSSNCSS
jgi:DNA-binding LacI/PurR family transcriptional regulator